MFKSGTLKSLRTRERRGRSFLEKESEGRFLGLGWILGLAAFQFIWGGQYFTTCHEFLQKSYSDKALLLPWNFLSFRNLASHYISWTSKEMISLQELFCCVEVFFLLRILLRTLDMIVLENSSLGLRFSKKILLDLYTSLWLLECFIIVWFWLFKLPWWNPPF